MTPYKLFVKFLQIIDNFRYRGGRMGVAPAGAAVVRRYITPPWYFATSRQKENWVHHLLCRGKRRADQRIL